MTRGSNHLLGLIVLVCSLSLLQGQQITYRAFDEDAMKTYTEDSAFDYMNYTVKPPSIWERLSWWFQSIIQEIFLNPNTPWLTRIAYYLLLILVVGVAVFYIIKLRYGGGLSADYQTYRTATTGSSQSKPEDFDLLIKEALNDQNFKLAIRYLYLMSLVSLANKGKISLKEWKSPYDYQLELKGELAYTYREIAQLFEYIWYGDFEAGEKEFKKGSELAQKLTNN